MEIDELRAKRYQFLRRLYDISEANIFLYCHIHKEIGEPLGFDPLLIDRITQHLHGEGLIDHSHGGHYIRITQSGIQEVERVESPEERGIGQQHIEISGGNFYGHIGQIRGGTYNYNDLVSLRTLVDDIATHCTAMELVKCQRAEFDTALQTLQSQLKLPQPNKTIITESLRSVRTILENTVGGFAANIATTWTTTWLPTLTRLLN